jgi:hypothetical protein
VSMAMSNLANWDSRRCLHESGERGRGDTQRRTLLNEAKFLEASGVWERTTSESAS